MSERLRKVVEKMATSLRDELHWKSSGAFCGGKSKGQRVDEQSSADGRR